MYEVQKSKDINVYEGLIPGNLIHGNTLLSNFQFLEKYTHKTGKTMKMF